jgi:hypothetical protein
MAVAAANVTMVERTEDERSLSDALRDAARYIPLLAIIALTVGIHVPTLHYYFFGDDFLVLGDIQARSFPAYMRDVILLDDLTPNWRPLTMAVYYGQYELFGLNATAWRIVNLAVHAATVIVLFELVLSLTRKVFVATAAAATFAVSASAVHTVTYITALPHVLSLFFLMSSLYALHRYTQGGERQPAWYWLSFALYVMGFLSNEGGVVIGLVLLVYFATYSLMQHKDVLDFTIKMVPFGIAAALLVGGLSGCGCQGVDGGFYGPGWHMARESWVYMSRMAYPVGAIPIDPSALEWTWGSIVAGFAIFFFVRGPNIARFAAVGMIVALMPYVPGKIWTATRYTYMAMPFFAILVAVGAGFIHHHLARFNKPIAHTLAAAAVIAVAGLYAWQTWHQTQPFLRETDRWELLAAGLQDTFPEVPAGTTIYVIDDEGLWSNAFWQPTWMTSVGRALYGDDVAVRALPTTHIERLRASMGEPQYLVRYEDGQFERASAITTQ